MIDERQRTDSVSVNHEPSHWMSYRGEASGYHEDLYPRSVMISVVLDAGCRNDFSGIRLVILRRDSGGAEATVRNCPELFKFYNGHHTHQKHRDALTSLRTSRELSNSLLHDYARGSLGRKICTVIFELVLVQTDDVPSLEAEKYRAELSPLQRQGLNPGDPAFHIVYDHAQRLNTPLLLFLKCSHACITGSYFNMGRSCPGPRIYVHTVRILPLLGNRPLPVPLPLPLLKRCIIYAFADRQRGWRKGLLSCGLVCRSWAPILDLFFQHFHYPDQSQSSDPPHISAVAVSLERTPFRAALVRGFTPLLYAPPNVRATTTFFESQNAILRRAKSVEELSIRSTHPSLSEELLHILGGLREVRAFKVSSINLPSYRQTLTEEIDDFNISEIQSAIALWPHLRTLKIYNWKSLITSNTIGPRNPSIQHLPSSDYLSMGTESEVGVLLVS
ncbi:hypothetical protein FPV67DRAFT_1462457 [Lyophyllum atratum]|nr:hypothetical protein FPV67DRAFT_1462457 [Lyophyllum atratum]